MFNRYGQKTKIAGLETKELSPVMTSKMIFMDEKRATLLAQIQQASIITPARFEQCASPLITHLANHCQLLPETANSYYAQPGGLVDHALNRTEAALTLFRQFLIHDDHGAYSEEQQLWQYALHTAALLQGIGKLQIDFSVKRFDRNRTFLADWNPLLGSLVSETAYYAYEFEKEADIEFRRRLNLLIARFLMPEQGFAWIASNHEVLAVWLALLNEDYYSAGTLGAILIRADAIALRRYFIHSLGPERGIRVDRHRMNTFSGGTPESLDALGGKVGAEFIQWLHDALASGQIVLDKPPLLVVPGGLLMGPEVFKWFIKEHPEYKNWLAIQTGFLSLGLHQVGAQGETTFRFENKDDTAMEEGILFSNYAVVLPDHVTVHQRQSGHAIQMSAMELIHQMDLNRQSLSQQAQLQSTNTLLSLAASGQWQVASPEQPSAHAGLKSRG